ncbi:MAG: DUF1080 domain-containing protein [Calditrichaeota bacterium]|nr:DUF1080 domain-containing protein [Calditrichota bacterium]
MRLFSFFILFVSFLIINLQAQNTDEGWRDLFNGTDFSGWNQKGGEAVYFIEDDMIVGQSTLNTPNSFLCTDEEFSDFILEFEVFDDTELNSGVQIRSNSIQNYMDGRVHGYQIEIDPSARAFSGGIYDEARRGWLYPLSRNEHGRTAFHNGEWNHFRVEAIGNTLRTWINGIMCTNLVDDMTAKGFIGLQVHQINDANLEGTQVRWRNIRIKTNDLQSARYDIDPQVDEISYLVNKLTEMEKRKGWRLLFDGKTSSGWRGAKLDHFPEKGWQIKDGILTILGTDGGEATGPGDIITNEQFSDFELELEFMISEGANSGIKYFVDPVLNKNAGSAIGCEFQILDDNKHPDAKEGINGNRTLASLYDLIAAEGLTVADRPKQFKGVGNWNKARILSTNGYVEHWLNDEKVVEYDRYSQMFRALVAGSKYAKWEGFGQWPQGHILLQDHGNTVHFRSIKVREF